MYIYSIFQPAIKCKQWLLILVTPRNFINFVGNLKPSKASLNFPLWLVNESSPRDNVNAIYTSDYGSYSSQESNHSGNSAICKSAGAVAVWSKYLMYFNFKVHWCTLHKLNCVLHVAWFSWSALHCECCKVLRCNYILIFTCIRFSYCVSAYIRRLVWWITLCYLKRYEWLEC